MIIITLMMETASSSETSVNFYQTARHNILEDSHLRYITYNEKASLNNVRVSYEIYLWLYFLEFIIPILSQSA
jgi:hypothetical protein